MSGFETTVRVLHTDAVCGTRQTRCKFEQLDEWWCTLFLRTCLPTDAQDERRLQRRCRACLTAERRAKGER